MISLGVSLVELTYSRKNGKGRFRGKGRFDFYLLQGLLSSPGYFEVLTTSLYVTVKTLVLRDQRTL